MTAQARSDELPLRHQPPDTPASEWWGKWKHGQRGKLKVPVAESRALEPDAVQKAASAALGGLCLAIAVQACASEPQRSHTEHDKRRLRYSCPFLPDSVLAASGKLIRWRDELLPLQEAAKAGDTAAFLNAMPRINWDNQPEANFVRGVYLALEAGAHTAARELSAQGARRHPESAELRKQAYVLSPPRVVSRGASNNITHRANRDWLQSHSDEYRGRWVALRNGELLGVASTMDELTERVGSTKGVLLTIV